MKTALVMVVPERRRQLVRDGSISAFQASEAHRVGLVEAADLVANGEEGMNQIVPYSIEGAE
jgi:hypothetical protein